MLPILTRVNVVPFGDDAEYLNGIQTGFRDLRTGKVSLINSGIDSLNIKALSKTTNLDKGLKLVFDLYNPGDKTERVHAANVLIVFTDGLTKNETAVYEILSKSKVRGR